MQQQQVAVRDLADRAAKMESAASELAIKADAKLKEADAYSGSGSLHELRVVEVFGGSISLYSLATGKTSCLTGKTSCRRSASWRWTWRFSLLGQVFQY